MQSGAALNPLTRLYPHRAPTSPIPSLTFVRRLVRGWHLSAVVTRRLLSGTARGPSRRLPACKEPGGLRTPLDRDLRPSQIDGVQIVGNDGATGAFRTLPQQ